MNHPHIAPWQAGSRRAAARIGGVAFRPLSSDRRRSPGLVGH
jgi:hypothetical protein